MLFFFQLNVLWFDMNQRLVSRVKFLTFFRVIGQDYVEMRKEPKLKNTKAAGSHNDGSLHL